MCKIDIYKDCVILPKFAKYFDPDRMFLEKMKRKLSFLEAVTKKCCKYLQFTKKKQSTLSLLSLKLEYAGQRYIIL